MKVIKEEKLPLARNFKLLEDTTEETTGDAIPYYFEHNPTPNYNLALDGGYPVARMLVFINSLDGKVALKHNHITDAAVTPPTTGGWITWVAN